jgi:endogenous inhibitor of DNA gyrase (YacG/DUF329 family)
MKKECPFCKKEFQSEDRRTAKFCSDSCGQKFRKFKTLENYNKSIIRGNCIGCGKEFTTRHKNRTFCSPECNRNSRKIVKKDDENNLTLLCHNCHRDIHFKW